MSDYINYKGVRYLKAKLAAPAAGISPDYITKLCRTGAVEARQENGGWYVEQSSLKTFLEKKAADKKAWHERQAAERKLDRQTSESEKISSASEIYVPLPKTRVAHESLRNV